MQKIVFLDAYTANPGDLSFETFYALGTFEKYDRTEESQFFDRAKDATVLIVNKFILDHNRITQLSKLKLICVAATGYNNVDIATAKSRGIAVCNVSGYSTASVAQHLFANLFSVLNQPQQYVDEVRLGQWAACPDFCFYHNAIRQVNTLTLGIFGYGAIGKKVAQIALAMDMKIIVCTRSKLESSLGVTQVSFDELLNTSDILTLHAPLSDNTKYTINKNTLAQMKPNAILINTSRGPLIDEGHLYIHLQTNPAFTAILDVLEKEPPIVGHPLFDLKNCYITPHIAWADLNAREKLLKGLVMNISAYFKGNPINIVNQ